MREEAWAACCLIAEPQKKEFTDSIFTCLSIILPRMHDLLLFKAVLQKIVFSVLDQWEKETEIKAKQWKSTLLSTCALFMYFKKSPRTSCLTGCLWYLASNISWEGAALILALLEVDALLLSYCTRWDVGAKQELPG